MKQHFRLWPYHLFFDFILTYMTKILDVIQMFARLFVLIGTIPAYLTNFASIIIQDKLSIQEQTNDVKYNGQNETNIEFFLKDRNRNS